MAVVPAFALCAGLLSSPTHHDATKALYDTNPNLGPVRISAPIALPTGLAPFVVSEGEAVPRTTHTVTVVQHKEESTGVPKVTPSETTPVTPVQDTSTSAAPAVTTGATASAPAPVSAPGESFLEKVVRAAESQIGIPYVYGGELAGVEFDCSGLTQWAYAQAGATIPRVANDQFNAMRMIPQSEALPGDLVFFHDSSDLSSYVYHVGIYLGGSDMMVVAPDAGLDIQIQSFSWGGDTVSFGQLDN
jgi:cell wall-associated NlpC family hydrolase